MGRWRCVWAMRAAWPGWCRLTVRNSSGAVDRQKCGSTAALLSYFTKVRPDHADDEYSATNTSGAVVRGTVRFTTGATRSRTNSALAGVDGL